MILKLVKESLVKSVDVEKHKYDSDVKFVSLLDREMNGL